MDVADGGSELDSRNQGERNTAVTPESVVVSSAMAPVALFVFNRPLHTRRTLEALRQNELSDQTELYVFCDGPRSERNEDAAVAEVRTIVGSEKWCGSVSIVHRDENFGLARSVREGVDFVLREHDRVIVLEDDIETSPGFLRYMNDALQLYASEERVMNVSGYVPETSGQSRLPETFFVKLMACWGWATWRRAWRYSRWDADELLLELGRRAGGPAEFDMDGTYPYTDHLRRNRDGSIRTWAVFWAASCFLRDGLSLFPKRSLIRNIGLDGSGENCHAGQDVHEDYELADRIYVERIRVEESRAGRRYYKSFYQYGRESSMIRRVRGGARMLCNKLLQKVPETLKSPIRDILGIDHPFGLPRSELKRLRVLPRFCESTVALFRRPLRIVDSASFLASHQEIFVNQIYRFSTDCAAPTIIDAGANLGLASIYFKRLFPDAKITAIEPDSVIVDVLRSNLAAFGYGDVEVICAAAWNSNKKLQFSVNHADAGRISDDGDVEVEGIRLRDLIEGRRIDLLKLDIEGAEIEVLADCKSSLDGVQRLFVEFHSFARQQQSLSTLLTILETAGFRYYIYQTGVHSPNPLVKFEQESGFDLQLNIFAVRGDQ